MTTHSVDRGAPRAELIDRYLLGDCTAAERKQVDAWLSRFDDGAIAIRALRSMQSSVKGSMWDVESKLDELNRKIDADENANANANALSPAIAKIHDTHTSSPLFGRQKTQLRSSFLRAYQRSTWVTIAVGLSAVFCIAFGWQSRDHVLRSELSGRNLVYTTENGERARVTLPDGSAIILNVGSRLSVGADYAVGNRTVRLDGEAIFDVLPQAKSPFTVIAGPSTTRVLGTRFLVRYYASDTSATVVVQHGKVVVGTQIVTANQEVNVNTDVSNVMHSAKMTRFSFSRNILEFDGIPLKDAIPDLNRWFDADVRLGDPTLGSRLLAGEYVTGSVANLAEMLRWTFDVKVVQEGHVLTIYPNH